MTKDPYLVLLVSDDRDDAQTVKDMLAEAEGVVFNLETAWSLAGALDRMAQERVDIILLDPYLPDSRGLDTLRALRAHARDVPILLWTHVESRQMAQQAVEGGAHDYLVKSRFNGAALVRTLYYAIIRQRRRDTASVPEKPEATTIGVLGAKGGLGATTVACHLSLELRRITSQEVLLADLDWWAGQVPFLMKAHGEHSIADAAANLHRLDLDYWKALVAKGLGGVNVVASPGIVDLETPPPVQRLKHVVRALRFWYPWIVIDLGRPSGLSIPLVSDLQWLWLVVTCEIQALYEAKQVLGRLRAGNFAWEKIRLILNRASSRTAISRQEVSRVLGLPVAAALPNSYAALCQAYESEKLLNETSGLRREIGSLAAQLAGVKEENKKRGCSLLRFLSGAGSGEQEPAEAVVPAASQASSPGA